MTSSCNLLLKLVYCVTSTCTDYDAFLHHYCMCIYTVYERNLNLVSFFVYATLSERDLSLVVHVNWFSCDCTVCCIFQLCAYS